MAHLSKILSDTERGQGQADLAALLVVAEAQVARLRALIDYANAYGWVRGAVVSELEHIVNSSPHALLASTASTLRGGANHPL